MATIVLSTVGSLIAGPIGGAIGSFVGSQVDAMIFAPPGVKGPRLKELDVQTSSYGRTIPAIFGRMRVAGSVIWSTEIIEKKKKSGGGKGQPSVTNYSYRVHFAVALSSRPALRVERIWADGRLIFKPGKSKLSSGGKVRFYAGDGGQMADWLISAKEHGRAPAYRGLAYCVFEDFQLADYGNRIPSLTFELVADEADIDAATVCDHFAPGALAVAGGEAALIGYATESADMARLLGDFASIDGLVLREEGAALSFVAPDPAMAKTLSGDDAITVDNETIEPSALDREGEQRDPPAIELRYHDIDRDYQIGLQASHVAPGDGSAERIELPVVLDAPRAEALARRIAENGREAEQRLMLAVAEEEAPALRPGDILLLPGRPGQWLVEESEYAPGLIRLKCRIWESPHGLPAVGAGSDHIGSQLPDRGETQLWVVDLSSVPILAGNRAELSLLASGTGIDWPGAAIAMEQMGVQYPLGEVGPGLVAGTLLDPLAPASALLFDRASAVHVRLLNEAMTLEGADDAGLALGANLLFIDGEYLQFADAVQIDASDWRLSDLRRGLFGSEDAAAMGHALGAALILLEPDMPRLAYDVSALENGLALSFAAESPDDDAIVTADAIVEKRSLVPLMPVHFNWRRDGDAIHLRWNRRPRLYAAWQDATDMPLIEARELYRIALANASASFGEYEDCAAMLETAMLRALLPDGADGLDLELRQVGDHALSPAATLHIPAAALI